MRLPPIDLSKFEVIPPDSYKAAEAIVTVWEKAGKPQDPFAPGGELVLNTIIAAWEYKLPEEAHDWYEMRKDYKKSELSITEQVHKETGRSLASYPYFIFKAMAKVFPDFKPAERENCIKLIRKWPMFQMANRI